MTEHPTIHEPQRACKKLNISMFDMVHYQVETTGQDIKCKDADAFCGTPDAPCGSSKREQLALYFAPLGCCQKPGADPGKKCAGGSPRQCEEVKANGLTFQCSMIGTQSEDSIDVLLLHGFPEYNKYWDPLLDHWEKSSSKIHAVCSFVR